MLSGWLELSIICVGQGAPLLSAANDIDNRLVISQLLNAACPDEELQSVRATAEDARKYDLLVNSSKSKNATSWVLTSVVTHFTIEARTLHRKSLLYSHRSFT